MSTKSSSLKIVITGGAGYIGSRIIESLPDQAEIVVIDNFIIDTEFKRKNSEHLQKKRNVTIVEANVSETDKYSQLLQATDVIVYMASLNSYKESNANPLLYLQENALTLQAFLTALQKFAPNVKKCILTSSRGVYGEGPYHCHACETRVYPLLSETLSCTICGGNNLKVQRITEEDQTNPSSYYGLSKKFQEDILTLYCNKHSIQLDIFRIFNVFGEKQGSYYSNIGIVPQIYAQISGKKEMYLQGNGMLARDFVYVGDVVKVMVSSILHTKARKKCVEIYNVGSGKPTSIKDIADFFADLGYSFSRKNVENYNDIKYSVAVNKKIMNAFNHHSFTDMLDFLSKNYKRLNK